ncbi:MAG TPA: hypothetical protein PKL73_01400 [Polyangiaceae bacterium]|jgi:hypothetical protein|nr:hypothetical protein [Polyangiaceae bacterium]HNZ21346.1 hypothetical protein [Polyangiaceae bacterium]HOD24789.1 hypothetical protein [Polyangiaceae bacterium]HOE47478.1 hypothetical protein [Polyangiaceae bacterium]HOG99526.1 hypothetical protein [Polyangiaceae bacterium]
MRSTTPPRRHKSCFHVTQPIDTHAVSRYLHIMSHVPSLRKSRIAFGSLSVFFFSSFLAIGCDQKTAPVEPGPEKIVAIETAPPPSVADTPANSAKEPEQPVASATAVRAPTTTTPPSQGQDTRPEPKSTASAAEEPKKGADASAASYSAWLQSAGPYEAGKQGALTVVLVAKDPYKCNDKYPYKFKLDPPGAGISYPQDTVRGMQVTPKRSTLSVPFVPAQAGPATVSGTLHFSVCTEERCLIEQAKLSVTVNVP